MEFLGVKKCPVAPESSIPKFGLLEDIFVVAVSTFLGVGIE